MIVGNLNEISRYKGISKNIDLAIDFVLNTDLLNLEIGKGEISGKDVYYSRQSYVAKPIEECAGENHNNYIDLQIVLSGKEGFGYSHISNPTKKVSVEYNDVKDVTKYTVEDEFIVPLISNTYAIVFPEDIHKPTIKLNDDVVEKLVIKIKCN